MGLLNFLRGNKSPALDKKAVVAQGGFESAANFTRERSVIYPSTYEETVNPVAPTRKSLLEITRYLVNNHAICERILTVAEIYGIGDGLLASATTSEAEWNNLATDSFDAWANSVFCSNNNQNTLYEMQKIIARELLIAGEVFILLLKTGDGYPQLQLVSSEQVRHSGEKSDSSIDGLYVNNFGKVEAYNIFLGKTFIKVDAANVIHLQRHKQIGQLRGISAFAASLNSLRDHKDLVILEKKAVKTHSALAVVVTKKGGEVGTGIADELRTVQSPETGRNVRAIEQATGGAVNYLAEGETLDLLTSSRSTDGFHNFLQLLIKDVCLNLSLPYEFLVNSEKLSGTGIRFVISDAASLFRGLQTIIIDGALNRIYGWVVSSLIKNGKLALPANDVLPYSVAFTRPISITVDQGRMDSSAIAMLQNSLLTYDSYYSKLGQDWKEQLEQKVVEQKFMDDLAKKYGINVNRLSALPAGAASIPVEEEAEDTPTNQEIEVV